MSNTGGLGQITAAMLGKPEKLREEIRKVRTLTDKPFAVNFASARHDGNYKDLLEVAIEEEYQLFQLRAGIHSQF